MLFTWASRGKLLDYVYDNNSATAARDGLEHVLRLALASNADRVDVLAHSMGNWVTVEAFRQIKISGSVPNASKFGLVILAAPDIDLDVFKSDMRRFGKPSRPFYVVLSKDDKALWASKLIGGGQTRVGDDPNVIELAKLGATVVDLTDVKADDPTNHGKFAQLAEVAPELRTVLVQGVRLETWYRPRRSDPAQPQRGYFAQWGRHVAGHPSWRARQYHSERISPHSNPSQIERRPPDETFLEFCSRGFRRNF